MPVFCPRARRSTRRSAGFSLIEVLVSILILSFGLLGIVGLYARANQIAAGADSTNRAAMLANEIGARMWTQRTTALTGDDFDDQAAGSGLADAEITIAPAATANTAAVEITWLEPGSDVRHRYTTEITVR